MVMVVVETVSERFINKLRNLVWIKCFGF